MSESITASGTLRLSAPAVASTAAGMVQGRATPAMPRPTASGVAFAGLRAAIGAVTTPGLSVRATARSFPQPARSPGGDAGRIMVFALPRVIQLVWASSISPGAVRVNYPVNRTSFGLVYGLRNDVEFLIRDIDRKPVLLGGETLSIHVVDPKADKLLLSRELVQTDPAKSMYRLTVHPNDMQDWPRHPVRWSVTGTREDGSEVALWTDRSYTAFGYLEVVAGPRPAQASSVVLDPNAFVVTDGVARSTAVTGAGGLGYADGLHTVQALLTSFTGTISVEATLATQPIDGDWFIAETRSYEEVTGTEVLNVEGNFMQLRLALETEAGAVSKFFVKA